MKSRLSYFLGSGIIILSIFIGTFIWHHQHHQEASNFKEKSFTAPISSKYIPTNADLVLHWKVNPTILPEYIENYQDRVNKNNTNKKVKLIRDSAFRLISLDFTKEISSFSGGYGSFGIFESNKQLLDDWLMVLEINKDINIDEELESISDPKIIDQNINPINNLNPKKLREIKELVNSSLGYLTVIKIDEHLKSLVDVFTIDPVKYKITEKIKKSFDPKGILNPGKMYSGI